MIHLQVNEMNELRPLLIRGRSLSRLFSLSKFQPAPGEYEYRRLVQVVRCDLSARRRGGVVASVAVRTKTTRNTLAAFGDKSYR